MLLLFPFFTKLLIPKYISLYLLTWAYCRDFGSVHVWIDHKPGGADSVSC